MPGHFPLLYGNKGKQATNGLGLKRKRFWYGIYAKNPSAPSWTRTKNPLIKSQML
jgi:hypothetical protein